MQISVRLNAVLAQITGAARLQVTVNDDATVADVLRMLTETYPDLGTRLERAVPVLGGNHAMLSDKVTAEQEVAFLMPVAGGEA
ncbi:MAG: MoaD/ThiS family protein [Caldilinea sp.]|jgi:molybdopterin converting factor small subunit